MSQAYLVTESGLYKVVLRSDKPDAKEFQNWVTQVVLPSIRKDGGYVMGKERLATGEMTEDEFILKGHADDGGQGGALSCDNMSLSNRVMTIEKIFGSAPTGQ